MKVGSAKKSRVLVAFITDIERPAECKYDIQNLVSDILKRLTGDTEKTYDVAIISDDVQELKIYEYDAQRPSIKLQHLSIDKALNQIRTLLERDGHRNWTDATVIIISDRNKFSESDKKNLEDFANSGCGAKCRRLAIYAGTKDADPALSAFANYFLEIADTYHSDYVGTAASSGRGGFWAAFVPVIAGGVLCGKIFTEGDSGGDDSYDSTKIKSVKDVQFAVVAPENFDKGSLSMIDVLMYEKDFENVVAEVRGEYQTRTIKRTYSNKRIADETEVKVQLHSGSSKIKIEDSELVEKWDGKYLRFSFAVKIPEKFKDSQTVFMAKVFFNDILATTLKFIANFGVSNDRKKISVARQDISSAFISYASQDRNKVLRIIQGIRKVRPDLDVFFDVESLHSGEHWEERIAKEIEARDILFLCWSKSARLSKWVNYEWRHALKTKGLDGIDPMPIEKCTPPEELMSLHFGEKLLYYSPDA